jgi:hypothetical protein
MNAESPATGLGTPFHPLANLLPLLEGNEAAAASSDAEAVLS